MIVADKRIDQAGEESFPASDPPAYNMGHGEPAADSGALLVAGCLGERDLAGLVTYCAEACELRIDGQRHVGADAIRASFTGLVARIERAEVIRTFVGKGAAAIELLAHMHDPHGLPVTRGLVIVLRPTLPSFESMHFYWAEHGASEAVAATTPFDTPA